MILNYYASRTCYEFVKDGVGREIRKTEELSSYKDCPAYVLLGQPGSGKTTTFREEATRPGCEYVSARDFITFDVNPDWHDKTLYIDGLDEVRAGKDDVLSPFDEIREKLHQLGRPRFRLSCREADWYGASDREGLAKVSPQQPRELFLDELTDGDLEQILMENHYKTKSEASSFLHEAQLRGLIELIKNPQILEMLVVAVSEGNEWPERKVDVFRLACEKLLLEEWNQTHNIAHRNQTPPSEELMQASGMLCAVMLLARKQGFASLRSDVDDNYPYIADMATEHMEHLHLVSRTRLFTIHNGHAEYSHRIFAEYLSAYYLSNKIISGKLLIARVLALMTGNDGGVVAELRGVYAWLVTLCHKERTMLMERDPLGVVLYGDVGLFDREERLKLLHILSSHAEKRGQSGIDYRRNTLSFGAFCQDDTEQDFRNILEKVDYGNRHQYLIEYVLLSMIHGKKLSGLTSALVSLIRDDGWRDRNRKQALSALIRFDEEQVLREILTDIHLGLISDPDDDLVGKLLRHMYPNRIKPDEIFNYYHAATKPNYIGNFSYFWAHDLTEQSANSQAAGLLDNLVNQKIVISHTGDNFDQQLMISKLLAKGIKNSGDTIEVERLYGWLGLGLDEYDDLLPFNDEDVKCIRDWLEQHPELQKKLIEYHLDKCRHGEDLTIHTYRISGRLFHADVPDDYGYWCLEKARTSDDKNTREFFFSQCVSTLVSGKGNIGISLELIEDAAADGNELKRHWDEYRVRDIKLEDSNHKQRIKQIREKRDQDKKAYLKYIRMNLSDIKAGTASISIFKDLGTAHYGYFIDSRGENAAERLNFFFQDDSELVHSALNGLQSFIHREDIPEVTDIIRMNMENKYYFYSRPYRAGMDALAENGIKQILELSEDKISKALAFYFVDKTGEEHVWHNILLRERPELVSRIYVEYGTSALRAGKKYITCSYSLAFEESYQQLASLAVLPLLKGFRTRSTSEQLVPLYDLLLAALQHADRRQFKQLIERKLSSKSMDTAQRVLWLTAGFVLDPNHFNQRLIEFISGKEARINYFTGFLSYRRNKWSPLSNLSFSELVSLIRLLGSDYAPYSIADNDDISGPLFNSSELIIEALTRLSEYPTDEATNEIQALLELEQFTKWHSLLKTKLYEQQNRKREALFQHAGLEKIHEALKNGPPANVSDLASIAHERIRELAGRIKSGNTNDFRQYWKEYPEEREHEETCRDRFLSDLRPLLENVQVDAQPEGRYADEGRADIRVSFGGYNVPIEVKCNNSKDLWHGIRKQLIELYTIDPGACGYGIYLVFWFGFEKTTPHPESGPKPRTPAELEERLIQVLKNDEERKKIFVCVVDCTA